MIDFDRLHIRLCAGELLKDCPRVNFLLAVDKYPSVTCELGNLVSAIVHYKNHINDDTTSIVIRGVKLDEHNDLQETTVTIVVNNVHDCVTWFIDHDNVCQCTVEQFQSLVDQWRSWIVQVL